MTLMTFIKSIEKTKLIGKMIFFSEIHSLSLKENNEIGSRFFFFFEILIFFAWLNY